jgi:hypothetical protein
MRADENRRAYEEIYAKLIESTLSTLATVDTPESASTLVSRVAQQVRELSATTPEFYALEFLGMFTDGVRTQLLAEIADVRRAGNDGRTRSEVIEADLNARLDAARAAGDFPTQDAVRREAAVLDSEAQVDVDALQRRLNLARLRLDAFTELASVLQMEKSQAVAERESVHKNGDVGRPVEGVYQEFTETTEPSLTTVGTPEPVSNFITEAGQQIRDLSSEEVYSEFTAAALSSLATVDSPESASSFVTQVAEQIRDLSATVPEFYALEFLDMFKDAVVRRVHAETTDLEHARDDIEARNKAGVAEINVRLKAARAAGDRAAQHALWREAEVSQAKNQAELDELTKRLRPLGLRANASKSLLSAFGVSIRGTPTAEKLLPESRESERLVREVHEEFTEAKEPSLATVDTPEPVSNFITEVGQQIRDLSYEEVYADLLEAALSSLATVDSPESASSFVTQVAEQIRDLSATVPEFYALEFLNILKDAVLNVVNPEMAALEEAKNDVVDQKEVVVAEINVRLHAARAAGDRAAQHALWRESEVCRAEGQARIDELSRRLDSILLRLDALKSLRSSLESAKRGTPTTEKLLPESRESERLVKEVHDGFTEATDSSLATVETPEPVSNFITQKGQQVRDLSSEQVYSEFTAATLSSLATVDTPESASSFVTQVAEQIRDLSATIPEFYALEAIEMLRSTFINSDDYRKEPAASLQAAKDAVARNEAVVAEINVRFHAARAAGDRAAQHALWRESEVSQAEGQTEVDRIARNLDSVFLRFKAFANLRSLFESKESQTLIDQEFATANREADLSAKNAELPPQIAASLPRYRLIRTAVDAEVAAAEFMRRIGFPDAKRTPSGADGGIDVIASGAVAQVKTHMKPIGRPDLQRLCGIAKGRTTLFFSLEGYTPEARKWGDLEGMALFRFDYQGEASPINRAAKALMAARPMP